MNVAYSRICRLRERSKFGYLPHGMGHTACPDGCASPAVWCPKRREWKAVKNLGWLRKNWKDVDTLCARVPYPSSYANTSWDPVSRSHSAYRFGKGFQLIAYMLDGRVYSTPFADRSVLAKWIARPVFLGIPIEWFGDCTEVRAGLT